MLLAIGTLVFFLVHLAPGGPVVALAGEFVTAETQAAIARLYGLDPPLFERYLRLLGPLLARRGSARLAPPGGDGPRATFNVAIRTVVVDGETGAAEYGVGGGMTWWTSTAIDLRAFLPEDAITPRLKRGTGLFLLSGFPLESGLGSYLRRVL